MKLEDMTQKDLEKALKTSNCTELAKKLGVYPNKIRRMAKKLGLVVPSHSEAQAKLLKQGKVKHPTEGRERTAEEKKAISKSIYDSYQNMTEEERKALSDLHKELWKETPENQKLLMLKNSAKAIRKTADEGSKTENFIKNELMKAKYIVDFHKKGLVPNEKLEIDILLPSLKTIIEINGPSHYEPIRGEDKLAKQKQSDAYKYGLLLSTGYCIIVVKHLKDPSDEYHRRLLAAILEQLKKIEKKFPSSGKRMIEVEV